MRPLAFALAFLSCSEEPRADDDRVPRERGGRAVETRSIRMPESAAGPERTIVMLPRARGPGDRFPLLVALHGQGESRRGVDRGAWGWVRDYELDRADAALRRGSLTARDFHDLVEPERLRALNEGLRTRPYRGIVVACPYTTDLFADPEAAAQFDRFVTAELVPRLRRELPVAQGREGTGIDGVSLGGIHALLIGLEHPETFGAVGGMQPAIRGRIAELVTLAGRGGDGQARHALGQRIRLMSSTGDRFRGLVLDLSDRLRSASVRHDVLITPGPHDYVWNRGPGAIEMLLYYDRVLRGEQD
ncbi:MAG: esterase [Deltaproteobacteria bacterium]|nr:esterase [Deltaproteobacteria bacterium]